MGQDADASVEAVEDRPFGVTPKCVVTVRADGLQIQGLAESAPFYIGLPALHILAELDVRPARFDDAVAELGPRLGGQDEELLEILQRLRWLGLVSRGTFARKRPVADGRSFGQTEPRSLDAPGRVALRLPLALRLREGRFEIIDHDGLRVAALDPAEVDALATLIEPTTPRAALAEARSRPGAESAGAIDAPRFERLLGVLEAAGLLAGVADDSE